jgi:beta-glucosidase
MTLRFGPFLTAVLAVAAMSTRATAQRHVAPHDTGFFEARARALVSRMTLAEKVAQMRNDAPAIPRLGIPAYGWWNEALHGVARAGLATAFPQAIGMAATWDAQLVRREAEVISTEARAKYNDNIAHGRQGRSYQGLTFWSPNVNIFRDPRWGRGQETYGEDPFLSGSMAVQFIRGMQGTDPRYLKTVATVKHFAVHSGPEPSRHTFDARVSERDLHETYLPQFRAGIEQGGAYSVMCAYNALYGQPACGSALLLDSILRTRWKFRGYVVSDCDAVDDIYETHHLQPNGARASAVAVRAGTDLDCGSAYRHLTEAVDSGLVSEAAIDTAVYRLFLARFRLGMFDSASAVPWSGLSMHDVDRPADRALARRVADESIVLLKNARHTLPLSKRVKTLAVIGPNANDADMLLGNYNGAPSDTVTPLEGIRAAVGPGTRVMYAVGSDLAAGIRARDAGANADSARMLDSAMTIARQADAVILVLGISPRLEGEEMRVHVPWFNGGDRTSLDLPAPQQALMRAVTALGKPTVLVLMSGSAVAIDWADAHVPGILEAWYPGQAGGTAIADVLFGDYDPAGRLPVTFYRSASDLPAFDDYSMAGRTYRFFSGTPLYPFGHGLSYTTFSYSNLRVSAPRVGADDTLTVSVDVRNTGGRSGDEVVQLYVKHLGSSVPRAREDLRGFARVSLSPGELRTVRLRVPVASLAYWNAALHALVVEAEPVQLRVGGSSADIRLTKSVDILPSR